MYEYRFWKPHFVALYRRIDQVSGRVAIGCHSAIGFSVETSQTTPPFQPPIPPRPERSTAASPTTLSSSFLCSFEIRTSELRMLCQRSVRGKVEADLLHETVMRPIVVLNPLLSFTTGAFFRKPNHSDLATFSGKPQQALIFLHWDGEFAEEEVLSVEPSELYIDVFRCGKLKLFLQPLLSILLIPFRRNE